MTIVWWRWTCSRAWKYKCIVRSCALLRIHRPLTQRAVRNMAGMTWAEGDQWSVAVDLPPGVYEFKLVAVLGDSGEPVEWEAGDNRQLTVRLPCRTVHT